VGRRDTLRTLLAAVELSCSTWNTPAARVEKKIWLNSSASVSLSPPGVPADNAPGVEAGAFELGGLLLADYRGAFACRYAVGNLRKC
jgi:hypothetical protein